LFRNSSDPIGVRVNTRSGPPSDTHLSGPEWWVAGLYLLIALFAQIELMHFVTFRGAELSVVLVVVVWYALRSDLLGATIYGLLAGLAEDIFSAQTGAAWTVSTTITALFVNYLTRWFFADSIPIFGGMVVVATLLRWLMFWVIMAIGSYPPGHARLHLHEAMWDALLNALFAVIAMFAARRVEDRATR
jgi:rod shape-determining protein MreD